MNILSAAAGGKLDSFQVEVNTGLSEVDDLLSVEENFELFLPLFRVVVLQFLIWELTLVLFNFLRLQELLVDKLEFLEHVGPGID